MLIGRADPRLSVTEGADLGRLEAVVRGDWALAREVLPLGQVDHDGGHVWLAIEWLREAARQPDDPEWDHGFDDMIAYATLMRWVDDAGRLVRAHATLHRD